MLMAALSQTEDDGCLTQLDNVIHKHFPVVIIVHCSIAVVLNEQCDGISVYYFRISLWDIKMIIDTSFFLILMATQ